VGHEVSHHGFDEIFLGGEIVVECRVIDSNPIGDLTSTQTLEATLCNELPGRVDKVFATVEGRLEVAPGPTRFLSGL